MAGAVVSIIPSFTSSNCQRNLTMFQEACLGQNSSGCIREDTTNGGVRTSAIVSMRTVICAL